MRAVIPASTVSVIQYTNMKLTMDSARCADGLMASGSDQIKNPIAGPSKALMKLPLGSMRKQIWRSRTEVGMDIFGTFAVDMAILP